MASGEQQPSQWSFECLLANLQGSNPFKNPAAKRFTLIEPFLNHDVILLQEVSIKTDLKTRAGYHKLLAKDNNEAGILLNKTKFVLDICPEEYLKSIIDGADDLDVVSKDFTSQLERMCIVKAIQNKGNNSVLIVSYHGPNDNKNKPIKKKEKKKQKTTYEKMASEDYCKLYTSLVKAWCFIQKSVGAQHLVIGEDFNFPVNKFREMVPYSEHGLKVYAQVNRTEHRKDKRKTKYVDDTDTDIIDYFVVSKSLELMECVMAPRYDHDPKTINGYFDHDPIVAKFTLLASTTDPLTHMMRELSLVSGPSVMVRKAGIYYLDWQMAHFTVVLEKLGSCSAERWKSKTPKHLSKILQRKDEMNANLNIKELRVILQHLKINVPHPMGIQKSLLINDISDISIEDLTDEQVASSSQKLTSVVPSGLKHDASDRKLLSE